jgi:hypothetical protein
MLDIVLTFVFSIVMFFFMLYPSMIVVKWLSKTFSIQHQLSTLLHILFAIVFSLLIGLFLQFY